METRPVISYCCSLCEGTLELIFNSRLDSFYQYEAYYDDIFEPCPSCEYKASENMGDTTFLILGPTPEHKYE